MNTVRYAPGEGVIVVTDGFVMQLPDGYDDLARSVWAQTRGADEPVVAALEVLASDGLTALPDFACVHWAEGSASGVVRGDLPVVVQSSDGTDSWSGDGVATWREHGSAGTVTRMSTDSGDAPLFSCGGGIVHGSGFVFSAVDEVAEQVDEPAMLSAPVAGPVQTIVGSVFEEVAAPVPSELPGIDHFDSLFGNTVNRTPEDAAVRDDAAPTPEAELPEPVVEAVAESAAFPAMQSSGDHDGHTVARPVMAPGARPPASAQLLLSNGRVVLVDAVLLIGRAPEDTGHPGEIVRLIEVPGRHRDLSRTHLEVRPTPTGLSVRDLSANGTSVVLPGQQSRRLPPQLEMPLPIGAVIELGDDFTIRVEHAG